jgi:tetratricopeptide (TPR) repeat protein
MSERRRRRGGGRGQGRPPRDREGSELRPDRHSRQRPQRVLEDETEREIVPEVAVAPTDSAAPAKRPRALQRDYFPLMSAIAVVVVALVVYANALRNGLVLDDRWVLLDNPLVTRLDGIWRAFAAPYWPAIQQAGQYRPLVVGSFAADWAISGGDPRWFHFVNLIWHALASLMVWALLRRLISPAGALAGALLFAVHPVHVEAVANVVGRSECMATVFVIGALLLHDRANAIAALLFALALASKESAIVFLGLAVAWDLLLRGEVRAEIWKRRWLYAGYAVVVVVYAGTLAMVFRGSALVVPASTWYGASTAERLLTVASVIPHYVRLLVVPIELSADYNPRVITLAQHLTAPVLTGIALLIVLLISAFVAWRRSRMTLFGLAWIGIALSPVSNVLFASGIVLAERTLYLPSVGFALLAGLLLEHSARRRMNLALAAGVVVLAAMATRSWTRTPVWKDNRTLVLKTIEDHNESYKVHQQAGGILLQLRDTAGSTKEYAIAASLFNRDPYFYREVAEAALRQNDFRKAIAMLDTAIRLMPSHPSPWLRLGDAHYHLGEFEQAIAAARRGYQLGPDSSRALVLVAVSALALGRPEVAIEAYRTGIKDHPGAWELHSGYADVLLGMGDVEGARKEAALGVRLSGGKAAALSVQARTQRTEPDTTVKPDSGRVP